MRKIFRRELNHLIRSPFGTVMLAVLLLCNLAAVTLFHLSFGTSAPAQAQELLNVCYLLLLPILASHSLTREKKGGSEGFLFSLPISTPSIVLGKFFATLTLFTAAYLPLLLVPLLLSAYGDVAVGLVLISYVGHYLLSVLLLAICYFLSSFFSRPICAAAVGAFALIALYLLPLLASVTTMHLLAAEPYHLQMGFGFGRLDLAACVSYLGGTALFLFSTVCVLSHRRTGAEKGNGIFTPKHVLCVCLAVLLLAFNLVSPILPTAIAKPNVAVEDAFELSEKAQKELSQTQNEITLLYLCPGGTYAAPGELYSFLSDMTRASDKLTLRVVDPKKEEAFLQAFDGAMELQSESVIVQSEKRYRMIDSTELYFYYNATIGNYRITPLEYAEFHAYLSQYGSAADLYSFVQSTTSYFDGESVLINAIRFCDAQSIRTAYVWAAAGSAGMDTALLSSLTMSGYDCKRLPSGESVPADCSLLLLNAVSKDLSEAEEAILRAYLATGGSVFLSDLASSATTHPRLYALLAEYGMSAPQTSHIVCEGDAAYCYSASASASYPNLFYAHVKGDSVLTGSFNGLFLLPNAHAITLTETAGIAHESWLYTTPQAYLADVETGKEIENTRTSYTVGAMATAQNGSRVLWITSANATVSAADSMTSGGNFALLLQAFNGLSQNTNSAVSLSPKAMNGATLSVTNGALVTWTAIFVLLVLGVSILGGVKYYLRKKK